ncbi:hypothetical protein DVH24_021021 [Malus domestica]|uniref:Acetyltransferase n=1 Tax=Malus domestica TaxID=3750 RepID=A0A498J8I4_MALDO|nr:hypothetical protein DVH24_021021 [Malus domestica]
MCGRSKKGGGEQDEDERIRKCFVVGLSFIGIWSLASQRSLEKPWEAPRSSQQVQCKPRAIMLMSIAQLRVELTPWDLQFLLVDPIQKGLLFHNPKTLPQHIQHLKASLSRTLDFFPPLSGRLATIHHDDNTTSFFINCNNAGALFVHAKAYGVTVSDINESGYVPRDGTSKPLLAVQVTELGDGIFIGCTVNHTVVDGTSFWHFFNSWSEISRGFDFVSKPPVLKRWLLDGTISTIRIPFSKIKDQVSDKHIGNIRVPLLKERVFHFSKEKIAQLKAKANAEIQLENKRSYPVHKAPALRRVWERGCSQVSNPRPTAHGRRHLPSHQVRPLEIQLENTKRKISSLQAVLVHLWRSIIRGSNGDLDPDKESSYRLLIGARSRMNPPLSQQYFGNAVQAGTVTIKAREVIKRGLGFVAWEMNKMVALHTEEKLRKFLECWVQEPKLLTEENMAANALVTSSSPRFDVYGNDFGWGRPVGVRSGGGNKSHGKITVFSGVEEGSIDIEACLLAETLEAMGNDSEFMDARSRIGHGKLATCMVTILVEEGLWQLEVALGTSSIRGKLTFLMAEDEEFMASEN